MATCTNSSLDYSRVSTLSQALTTVLTGGSGPRELPWLAIAGYVDLSTVDQFVRAIQEASETGREVILDLTQVEFVGTAAMTELFRRRDSFAAVLVAAGSIVDRALAAAGFPTIPTSHPTTRLYRAVDARD